MEARLLPAGAEGTCTLSVADVAGLALRLQSGKSLRTRVPPLSREDLIRAISLRASLAFHVRPSRKVAEPLADLSLARG